jgi:O-antigen ligase
MWLVSRLGTIALVVGSAWSAPVVDVLDLTLTGDRLLGLAAVLVTAVLVVRGRLRWTGIHTALAVFVGAQIVTTMLNVGGWPPGIRFVTVYVMGFACFALASEWSRGAHGQRRMARAWIGVGAVLAIAGALLGNFSNVLQRWLWGTGAAQILRPGAADELILFGARVTMNEWNLYSSFLLVPFALCLWAWRREIGGRAPSIVVLAATVFGLVAGMTRAAWLAMAAMIALWRWVRRPPLRQIAVLGLIAAAAFVLQAATLRGTSPLWSRVVEPIQRQVDDNMLGRLRISQLTIASWRSRPLLGHGAGSVNRLTWVTPRGKVVQRLWNGNAILFVLHDSGLVGLAALLGLVVVVWRRAVSALRLDPASEGRSVLAPLLVAGGALCFAFQFTHGLWLMYPYVYLGFLASAMEARSPDT